jgi:hypothetical protein
MKLAFYRQKKKKAQHLPYTKGQQLGITGALVASSTSVTSTSDT